MKKIIVAAVCAGTLFSASFANAQEAAKKTTDKKKAAQTAPVKHDMGAPKSEKPTVKAPAKADAKPATTPAKVEKTAKPATKK